MAVTVLRLGFLLPETTTGMFNSGATIRGVGLGAASALALTCALALPVGARQASSNASDNKTSTAKKTTSSTHPRQSISTAASGVKKSSSKTPGKATGKRSSRKKTARARGQQKIDSERARAIQEALIREHYLGGEPTGTWNQASEDAMRKYQADHGWQSKVTPDSRALISLGLGPSKDHLLNPESAMTTVPDRPKSETASTTHTAPAASDSRTPTPSSTPTPPASDPGSPQ